MQTVFMAVETILAAVDVSLPGGNYMNGCQKSAFLAKNRLLGLKIFDNLLLLYYFSSCFNAGC